jgi:hypothetical protein
MPIFFQMSKIKSFIKINLEKFQLLKCSYLLLRGNYFKNFDKPNMMKVAFSTLFLLFGTSLTAQVNQALPVADTTNKPDTVIELKRDIQDNIPTLSLEESDLESSNNTTVSSILTAGRDPFLSQVEYNFNPVRYRLRGYEYGADAVCINNIDFTGLDNGFTPFGLWSGLSNVMRSRQTAYGLEASTFSSGSIGLNTNVDLRAGAQWAQTQLSYGISNRNYRHRLTLSQGSGFNRNGWAYAFAISGRYGEGDYAKGVYTRALSYYAAVDKRLGNKNTISLIAFGAPSENGRQAASMQEAMDLAGTNYYNPSWGYQNGKVRNANVAETFQPAFMAVHEMKPTSRSSWTTSVAYTFGKRKLSGLDWYNAPDPRPDYYRYLPSYYANTDPSLAASLTDLIRSNPELIQVNWNRIYEVNRNNIVTVNNVDGQPGNNVTGKRSLYILGNRVNDLHRFMANTNYSTKINDKLELIAGANYQQQVNHYYQEVKDLLGGDFWVNVNQFAERDNPLDPNILQYDIDHPNQLKKNGGKYGYDYKMTMTRIAAWAQTNITLRRFDFAITGELSHSSFFRSGMVRNGLFPNDSYGASPKQSFWDYTAKAGITYKVNGRNYFFVRGGLISSPPLFDNVYLSPRTRDNIQSDLKSETTQTIEGGYKLNSPRIKAVVTGFYTTSKNGYDVMTFYHDQYKTFVNYALSGIDKVFYGVELGLDAKLTSTLTFNGAASIGRYYYDSRQQALVTVDNSSEVLAQQTVYVKNYRIPSSPQNAYSTGLFYRSPKYWYVSLTGNYFTNMYLSFNPMRRTSEAIANVDPSINGNTDIIHQIIDEQKLDNEFTLDFYGGWSKRLPKKYNINHKPTYIVFNVSVNNILNNTNIRSGGYEQLRFDNTEINKFPPKYYNAYGINYSASVAIRF